MNDYKVNQHEPSMLPDGNWKLVWSDEFEGDTLDCGKWEFRRHLFHKKHDAWIEDEGIAFDGASNIIFKLIEKDGKYYSSQLQTGENWYDRPGNKSTRNVAPFSSPRFHPDSIGSACFERGTATPFMWTVCSPAKS